ncbi:MAG: hypothetical protein JST04_12460 [Bdellovibrionales bacterium]|nr:hypothetical protein [Bdellovibrionales bacterium]
MLSIALALVAQASASSFYEIPFPDTVRNTPTIVRGKIGKSTTEWTTLPDGGKHLFTYYEVEVNEGFKGGPRGGAPIRIREIGGTKDGVSLNVSGTANFDKGEDVVVLLGEPSAAGDNAYPVMGMMMGKFNVEKGADGKEYLRGAGLGSSTQPGIRHEHGNESTAQISLEALRDIIRTQASEAKAAPSPTAAPVASDSGLLFGKGKAAPEARTEIHEENLGTKPPKPAGGSRTTAVFVVGVLIGAGAWFLKSRKKRR